MRDGNRRGIMTNIIKQLLVFWDLFSLENLQLDKWIWHHHWAGDKLAHFSLVCSLRPLDSSLSAKRSFHSYSQSLTIFNSNCFLVFQLAWYSPSVPFWPLQLCLPRSPLLFQGYSFLPSLLTPAQCSLYPRHVEFKENGVKSWLRILVETMKRKLYTEN